MCLQKHFFKKITPTKYKLKSLAARRQEKAMLETKSACKDKVQENTHRNIQMCNNTKTKSSTRKTKILTNKDLWTKGRATMMGIETSTKITLKAQEQASQ